MNVYHIIYIICIKECSYTDSFFGTKCEKNTIVQKIHNEGLKKS